MKDSSNHLLIFLKVWSFGRPTVPLLPSGVQYSLLQNSLKFSYDFNWNPRPGDETSDASLKVHIFSMSGYQQKPSILGESRASRADSCVFQVSLKITSSLSYQSFKIRRRNNRGNLLVFAVLRWEDERVIESSSNLFESMLLCASNGALITVWCPIFTSTEFTKAQRWFQLKSITW